LGARYIGAYSDTNPSNAPALQNFKWSRAINALTAANPQSEQAQIPISGSATLFSGSTVKRIVYLESDIALHLLINGTLNITINPLIQTGGNFPGMYLSTEGITSIVATNPSTTAVANLFLASVE
jgi:hypothetical protein